jgi:hypothetical protein
MFALAACVICRAGDADLAVELQAQVSGRSEVVRAGAKGATITARAGDSLMVRWSVLNSSKILSIPDVTVHVSLNGNGHDAADAAYESALVMDFEPGSKSSGEVSIQAPAAAGYLLRVETIGAAKKFGREVSAELDVRVQ